MTTWNKFIEKNAQWWNGLNKEEHPLSGYTLESIKDSDDLNHQEMIILRQLNTKSNHFTIDSQLPGFNFISSIVFEHFVEIIKQVQDQETDEIEGSVERFALNLFQKNKTQEFMNLDPSTIVWNQRAYIQFYTTNSTFLLNPRIFQEDFIVHVSEPGSAVPESITTLINVTRIYPINHKTDSDLCLRYTNIQAFNLETDFGFKQHWGDDVMLPFDDMKNVRSVIIVQKKFPQSQEEVSLLRTQWIKFLQTLIPSRKRSHNLIN